MIKTHLNFEYPLKTLILQVSEWSHDPSPSLTPPLLSAKSHRKTEQQASFTQSTIGLTIFEIKLNDFQN
ncbi:hypothetical protein HQ34_03490 [Porphyromonas cangingivalis]|nr:hypothetical protein HQ34_03490 [Porphyromonas cangingivalis]